MKSQFENDHSQNTMIGFLLLCVLVFAGVASIHRAESVTKIAALEAETARLKMQTEFMDELNSQLIVRLGCITFPFYNESTKEACSIEMAEDDFGDYDNTVRTKLEN